MRRSQLGDHRIERAVAFLALIIVLGTIGYLFFGLTFVDALYQTMITISTVGFQEIRTSEDTTGFRVFTIFVILAGTGTAFYTLGVLFEGLVEGRLTDQIWRRRMERTIEAMTGHVIVCGGGRVGQRIARDAATAGRDVVIIDSDEERMSEIDVPFIVGDATEDAVLRSARIETASALVATVDSDAANLYVTLTARSMSPDLFIVARARLQSAEPKLIQAGADRVVNPQYIGGERIAAMILQPTVADFLDVVMRDGGLEFRLAEVKVPARSKVANSSLRDAHLRDKTGALVLATRNGDGRFLTNPPPDTLLRPGEILVAVGTATQLDALRAEVAE